MDKPGKMLITIRPGPVLHVWCDGIEVARVALSPGQALGVVQDIIAEIRWPQ